MLAGPKTDENKIARLQSASAAREPGSEILYAYTSKGEPRLVELRAREVDDSHRVVSVRDLTRLQAAQEALAATTRRLRSLLADNADAVLTVALDGTCIDANAAATTLFGYERQELLGRGFTTLATQGLFPGDDIFPDVLRAAQTLKYHATYAHKLGSSLDVECSAIPIVVRGVTEGAYVIARDITAATRLATSVSAQAKRTHALYLIAAATSTTDTKQIDAGLALVLEALEMQYGYVGQVIGDSIHMEHVAGEHLLEAGAVIELAHTHVRETLACGDVFAIDDLSDPANVKRGVPAYREWHGYISAPLSIAGRPYGAIGFLSKRVVPFNDYDRDFIRLVAALISSALEIRQQQLSRLAYHDVLTGLPNRAKFMLELEAAIRRTDRPKPAFALHFIDLDHFKNVNDRSGQAVGDFVLQEAARRLQQTLRRNDNVPARFGGDEFVLLQAAIEHPSEAEAFGARIVRLLSEPYIFGDVKLHLSASVGIAIFPDDGHDAEALLRSADLALYRAKTNGKNRIEISGPRTAG